MNYKNIIRKENFNCECKKKTKNFFDSLTEYGYEVESFNCKCNKMYFGINYIKTNFFIFLILLILILILIKNQKKII